MIRLPAEIEAHARNFLAFLETEGFEDVEDVEKVVGCANFLGIKKIKKGQGGRISYFCFNVGKTQSPSYLQEVPSYYLDYGFYHKNFKKNLFPMSIKLFKDSYSTLDVPIKKDFEYDSKLPPEIREYKVSSIERNGFYSARKKFILCSLMIAKQELKCLINSTRAQSRLDFTSQQHNTPRYFLPASYT